MLDTKKVKELLDMGFTHEQVAQMMGQQQQPKKETKTSVEKLDSDKIQKARKLLNGEIELLLGHFKQPMARFLFLFGIHTALRISDIIGLQVGTIRNLKTGRNPQTGEEFKYFIVREKKTKKIRNIGINPELQAEIDTYIANKSDSEYLFPSREGKSAKNPHITRKTAWLWIKQAALSSGIELVDSEGIIGTHTMRKIWAYNALVNGLSIDQVSLALNHSSVQTTKVYLGFTGDDQAAATAFTTRK